MKVGELQSMVINLQEENATQQMEINEQIMTIMDQAGQITTLEGTTSD